MVFSATFSNTSAISWRPVLVVEEARVLGENHRPWASIWLTLSPAAVSRVYHFFVIYKAGREPNRSLAIVLSVLRIISFISSNFNLFIPL